MLVTIMATTTMGLEAVLNREVKALGVETTTVVDGRVEFEGDLAMVAKANLWLRTAGRIYIKIGEFTATTFDELFEGTKALPWHEWIQPLDKFPVVDITSRKSELFSKSDGQAIVKKAIVEQLREAHGAQHLPERGALFPIRVQILNDVVTLSIDATGKGLNKRGYRDNHEKAPLRETLAAGLILLSRFRADKDVLLDPFCGTGTILIEGAMIAQNRAPGLYRKFNSEQWDVFPSIIWQEARADAKAAITDDEFRILGSDINKYAIKAANEAIAKAGIRGIKTQVLDIADLRSRYDKGKIITNPPYGERLEDDDSVKDLYRTTGRILREHFSDWHHYIISGFPQTERYLGAKATKERKLYNGGIKCRFYQYF